MDALSFRRQLRRGPTDAERKLWSILRAKRMGPKFRRQCTVGPYTVDFLCVRARLAIEADGGQHYEEEGRARDARRDAFLTGKGIRVLRFTDREILQEPEVVGQVIWEALRCALGPPLPARPRGAARPLPPP